MLIQSTGYKGTEEEGIRRLNTINVFLWTNVVRRTLTDDKDHIEETQKISY